MPKLFKSRRNEGVVIGAAVGGTAGMAMGLILGLQFDDANVRVASPKAPIRP